jgi:hypothetical protein
MLCAVCCMLCAVCCMLCAVCCMLCAVCCVLYAVCCVLYVYAVCWLCAVCCVLYAVCCTLYSVCCILYPIPYTNALLHTTDTTNNPTAHTPWPSRVLRICICTCIIICTHVALPGLPQTHGAAHVLYFLRTRQGEAMCVCMYAMGCWYRYVSAHIPLTLTPPPLFTTLPLYLCTSIPLYHCTTVALREDPQ